MDITIPGIAKGRATMNPINHPINVGIFAMALIMLLNVSHINPSHTHQGIATARKNTIPRIIDHAIQEIIDKTVIKIPKINSIFIGLSKL
jgi:hypothetical protein